MKGSNSDGGHRAVEEFWDMDDGPGTLLAIVVRCGWLSQHCGSGVQFFTPPDATLQLGWLRHPRGKIIPAHRHKVVPRTVQRSCEALLVKSGKLRALLYGVMDVQEAELTGGDVILVLAGWHGCEVLEECEVWEVKQGPYMGTEADKEWIR